MKKNLFYLLQDFSRRLGALVCFFREHRYFYASGSYNFNCAYSCVRCGELDRPIESLPETGPDEYGDWSDIDLSEDIAKEAEHERRWFRCLPYPKWI
jgi:hypothetical protein